MDYSLVFRTATPADEEVLYQMLCLLENETLDRPGFAQVLRRNLANADIRYLVAEAAGQPVGMASCHVQPVLHHAALVAEIQEMYVDPALRSRGIGKQLVEALAAFAHSRGATSLEVTSNQLRLDTHRFYEREGFAKTHYKLVRKKL
ncbi:GNAT family N-acetyltransferase [Rhabdobacter roseus]|uniref:PhnO protein n=1 Tax=Rhabdobacter roseus TaxID=1655419 RepID=A0A840TI05_9BACT|nr:GNAT family N-acetyltransferase [Rhabdobacter roseus]MBB5283796.1 PhnO protein [Rhabdobacter roseus]